ncbi:PREDICTED: cytochrome P450 9e2-like [Nicrophorus vespilloides]|uniref:Cytochrome P450 9e2-like n=1 Tax=Nicrophorus vespilloides TaxID=110193 RepID=A0ABM1M4F7_NICVS|nr:PREDICTED: cytochrome P450 9e2-like [Nicrophorus vespilloides]
MIQLILLVVLSYLLCYYVLKPYTFWKERGIQYVQPVPIFGNVFRNIIQQKSLAEIVKSIYDKLKHQRYSGMYQFMKPVLLINDIDLIKKITIKDFDHFTDHVNHAREDVDRLWSKNLFAMTGSTWRDMRGTLSPAFTASKMRFMFSLINECAENLASHYLKKNEELIEIEMRDTYTRVSNDVIASCAFGIKCDSLNDPNNVFYVRASKAFDYSGIRQSVFILYHSVPKLMKFLGWKIFDDEMGTFFRGVIDESIKIREDKGIVRPDMLNLLMEAKNGKLSGESNKNSVDSFASTNEYSLGKKITNIELTNENITAQCLIFFNAGFDTTSYAMCFLTYELALNGEIQDKLREEIITTWKKCEGNVTYQDLIGMTYLDMVISEVLRKWPPVPYIERLCTKDYTIVATRPDEKDYKVKKNDFVYIPVFGIHRDSKYYPNPEKFDPERFAVENREKMYPSTYLPFGSGPRNCIGSRLAILETKVTIFHLLRNFQVLPTKKTSIPMVISRKQFTVSSQHDFWLGLKRLSS